MDKISVLDKTFVPFIGHDELMGCIDSVAERINKDFEGATDVPIVLCILNGAIMFTAELMKRLDFDCELVSMKLSSYSGTRSTGKVRQVMGLTGDISGKTVIIVEDIVDTGNTIVDLKEIVREKGAKDCKVCTMLLKPEVYKKDVVLDYVAMEIPNRFIVGFGLDYNELGRNYKDIYILDE